MQNTEKKTEKNIYFLTPTILLKLNSTIN